MLIVFISTINCIPLNAINQSNFTMIGWIGYPLINLR